VYAWTDVILVFLVITNLLFLGSSRLQVYIRVAAVQGVAIGLLPTLTHLSASGGAPASLIVLGVITAAVKGVFFPWILTVALRRANVLREPRPLVGYHVSTIIGIIALVASFRMGHRLPLPGPAFSTLAVPTGLFTFFIGLFLIVSRRKALTQVIGYLVLENGIFALGVALVAEVSLLVEIGVLLDVFVGVFVMQIAVHHISNEFAGGDADRLSKLEG
jgi:hydrogenase-4 component E